MNNLVWIEINKEALKNNIKVIRQAVGPEVLVAPVVKSNAYGHGLAETGRLFLEYGADWLCVNSIDEAGILRRAGADKPILVIGYIPQNELGKIIEYGVRVVVYHAAVVEMISRLAGRHKKDIAIHIKVDTGMSRQGIAPETTVDFVNKAQTLPGIKVEGLATHYANADDPEDTAYFQKQLREFSAVRERLNDAGINLPIYHSGNSAATLLHPEAHFKLVRPGLSAYGYYASKRIKKMCCDKGLTLKPCLTLKTKIIMVKELAAGTSISYGRTYKTEKPSRIAVLPVGYYDGLDRKLSNRGEVLINGKRCPIRGRVCMNMCVVDITGAGEVKQEDEAVVIGRQGEEEITVNEVADKIGTIPYEITTRLRESIARRYA